MRETWIWSLGWEDKGKATHSSILAWNIPWTILPMESQRVGHDWVTFTSVHFSLSGASQFDLMVNNLPASTRDARDMSLIPELGRPPWRRSWQPTPVFLPGESRGQSNLAGYSPWVHKSWTQLSHLAHTHSATWNLVIFLSEIIGIMPAYWLSVRVSLSKNEKSKIAFKAISRQNSNKMLEGFPS